MKWTTEQTDLLKQMCISGASNAGMAEAIGVPLEEIHHKRSQLGLTIAKVKALKGTTPKPAAPKAAEAAPMPRAGKPAVPAKAAEAAPTAPAALERFQNAGEDCIVLARHGDIALIVMPGKRIAAFCVPLQLRVGDTSWWQGHYFDTLETAYLDYGKRVTEEARDED